MAQRRPAQVHGVLCIDKPLGWTSRDVVNKVGHLLGERRCGHAGTLDPDASGLLLIAFGEAGKAVRWLQDCPKTYETEVRFGTATSTDDAAGETIRTAAVPELTQATVQAALVRLIGRDLDTPGEIDQVPPQVSALLQDGVRDYVRVRRGEIVDRPARAVWLGEVRVLSVQTPVVRLRVTCGAGFYIRSLARDLGEAMATAAHVETLRRVHGGGFDVEEALTIEALLALEPDQRRQCVVAVVPALKRLLPFVAVDAATALELRQGKTPVMPGSSAVPQPRPEPEPEPEPAPEPDSDPDPEPEFVLVLEADGETPVCIAAVEAGNLRVERGFAHISSAAPLDDA